ncbi:MAG: YraN family protein [Bdellovibrio sp.]
MLPTAPVSSTAGHSLGLKSTSKNLPSKNNNEPYWAHKRGLDSEKFVQDFYKLKGYELLAQRVKTPFAEVDLLLRAPEGHLLMVEVKTTNLSEFQNYRITIKQKKRLLRALHFLAERLEVLVEVHWAFVTKEGEITVIEDISG